MSIRTLTISSELILKAFQVLFHIVIKLNGDVERLVENLCTILSFS